MFTEDFTNAGVLTWRRTAGSAAAAGSALVLRPKIIKVE